MNNAPWLLILGANSDIAIACAKRYAQAGFNLYLAGRRLEALEQTAQDLRLRYAVECQTLAFDARDFSSHRAFFTKLPTAPSGVILAFGVLHSQQEAQADFALAHDMIESNYSGAVSILEIIAADFAQRQHGFIVAISSVAGDRGRQSNYIYGSTKAALSVYLAGLRHRLSLGKTGVLLLTVKPGFVATKMTATMQLPPKLTAQPQAVAEAIFTAVQRKKSTIYVKSTWRLIMWVVIHTPNFLFHKTRF